MNAAQDPRSFPKRPCFAVLLLLVLALGFDWPYLMGGFFGDDVLLIHNMEQDPLPYSRWLGAWASQYFPGLDAIWWNTFMTCHAPTTPDWLQPSEYPSTPLASSPVRPTCVPA